MWYNIISNKTRYYTAMNVTLIGMPGCGKSTCGILAAKIMCLSFLDTDLLIQQNEGMKLQNIINEKGGDYFAKAEEDAIITLYTRNCVIATGGSAVYSDAAMKYLKENSVVVYLRISFANMRSRIKNPATRGIMLKDGETLQDMYNERAPLYEKYADEIIDCDINDEIEKTVHKLCKCVQKYDDRDIDITI